MLKEGTKLDNYEIRALLGAGGFGRVWRAKDLTVKGRQVAIKELTDPTPERLMALRSAYGLPIFCARPDFHSGKLGPEEQLSSCAQRVPF